MTATELAARRERRAAWLPGSAAAALASSRHPHPGHRADAPGGSPFHGGQQPQVILRAGLGSSADAATRGNRLSAPGPVEIGLVVQHVERYAAPGIPRFCSEQIIQPGRTRPGAPLEGAQDLLR